MRKSKWKHPNAQKHAVFSRFLIIDGEDPRQFEKLVDDLAEEWQPEGKTEHEAVLDMAKPIWLKRRFQLFLMVKAIRNAAIPDHPSYDERMGLEAFLAQARISPEDAFYHGSHFLRKDQLDALMKAYPKAKFKSETEWFAAIEKSITSTLFPIYDTIYSDPEAYHSLLHSAATFSDDLFDRAIALEERLNTMIDRATKRLIQIKAMKQMLGHACKKPKADVIKLPERKSTAG